MEQENVMTNEIEEIGRCGLSEQELYRCYRDKIASGGEIEFTPEEAAAVNEETLRVNDAIIRRLVECGRAVGHPQNNVFAPIGQTQYTSYMRFAAQSITFFLDAAERTQKKTQELCTILGVPLPMTQNEIRGLYTFCNLIGEGKTLPQDWIVLPDLPQFSQELMEFCTLCEENAALDQSLFTAWKREFAELDAEALLKRWDDALAKSSLLRGRRIAAICKEAGAYCKIAAETEEIHSALSALAKYQKNAARIEEILTKRAALLPGVQTNPSRESFTAFKAQALMLRSFCERVRESGTEKLRAKLTAENRGVLQTFYGTWRTFSEVQSGLYKNFRITPEKIPLSGDYLSSQIFVCKNWLSGIGNLREWIAWNEAKQEAIEHGLGKVVAAYEGGLLHAQVMDSYEKGMLHALWLLAKKHGEENA